MHLRILKTPAILKFLGGRVVIRHVSFKILAKKVGEKAKADQEVGVTKALGKNMILRLLLTEY